MAPTFFSFHARGTVAFPDGVIHLLPKFLFFMGPVPFSAEWLRTSSPLLTLSPNAFPRISLHVRFFADPPFSASIREGLQSLFSFLLSQGSQSLEFFSLPFNNQRCKRNGDVSSLLAILRVLYLSLT